MKTKQLLLITTLLFFSFQTFSQPPNWVWSKSAGGTSYDNSKCVVTSPASGDVYVAGDFESLSITFGSSTLTNANPGSPDIFFAKYNSNGNATWGKRIGNTNTEHVRSIATNVSGNVYIAGDFLSPIITIGTDTLILSSTTGNSDTFLAKYDSSGNVLWAKNLGWHCYFPLVACDESDNVYVTGQFIDTLIFGTDTLTIGDMFLAKFNPSGNALWANSFGGTSYDNPSSITTDSYGDVYVTGSFNSPTIAIDTTVLTNNGFSNLFLMKYSTIGNLLWAKSAGGDYDDRTTSLTTDTLGNVIIAGHFYSSSITFGSTNLTNGSFHGDNIFIAKYNSTGNAIWANGTTGGRDISTVATDISGNIYLSGSFLGTYITFGSITLTNTSINATFLVKYNSSAGVISAANIYGGCKILALDADANIYILGDFIEPNVIFGTDTLLNAGGSSSDIFLAKTGSTVGINELSSNGNSLFVYPNPTNNSFIIKNISANQKSLLQIINPLGKVIYSEKLFGKNEHIVDANFTGGIYFVSVSDGEKNVVRKLIVE